MTSYAITGASKGIGREFVRQLAANPANTVLAIVRDVKSSAISELASKHPNIHLITGDATDPNSILEAAKAVGIITAGKLDVLIHNSNAVDQDTMAFSPTQFPFDADTVQKTFDLPLRTAVYGGLWTTNAFLPLIEKGKAKKIIHISSGIADLNVIKTTGVSYAVPYSVAKAGMNVQVAKYAVELAPKRVSILALSPGWVDTWEGEKPPEVVAAVDVMLKQFQNAIPGLKGQIQVEESVRKQLKVIDELTIEKSGLFLSHEGNENWW